MTIDFGADGPAMLARPTRNTKYQQRITATRSVTVERIAYTDGHVIDQMHHTGQLSDTQHSAACRLYGLFLAAGLSPRVTPRQDSAPGEADDEATEAPPEDARIAYRRTLRHAGPVHGPILDATMHGQHPGRMIGAAIEALDDLARGWGMLDIRLKNAIR